jgi:cytoskeletal protein CcmA (bactofilin family)
MNRPQDTLVIDPVKMNIVNRVAAGTCLSGELNFQGGLLLQGQLDGRGEVAGKLVIWHSGQMRGHFLVLGDVYLLGQLGQTLDDADATDEDTRVECQGTVYIASTGVSTGRLIASRLRMYDGAILQGPFTTLRQGQSVPVLAPE